MKHNAAIISTFKMADTCAQIAMFLITIWMLRYWSLESLFLIAATQYLSSLVWLLADRNLPKMTERRMIRILFPLLGTLGLIGIYGELRMIQSLLFPLLLAGPLLGIWYFAVTIQEIRFYKRFTQKTFR